KRRAEQNPESAALAGPRAADGKLAISTGGPANETFVWKTNDGAETALLTGRGRPVGGLAWSADGQTLAWRQSRAPIKGSYPLDRCFRFDELQFGEKPTEETVP